MAHSFAAPFLFSFANDVYDWFPVVIVDVIMK
jgi:hypothetical protein